LTIAITALADRGENILIPKPSFPLYWTVSSHYEIETREYNLLPEKNMGSGFKSHGISDR